jgi:hypothetical protein
MTNRDGTITLRIREYMDYGLEVYDAESQRVGVVDDYDGSAGYMVVRVDGVVSSIVYIPFSAITHIDPREVFVAGSTDELRREHRDPPSGSTVTEAGSDPDTGDDDGKILVFRPT